MCNQIRSLTSQASQRMLEMMTMMTLTLKTLMKMLSYAEIKSNITQAKRKIFPCRNQSKNIRK